MDMGKKVEKQSVKVKKITVVTISLLIAEAIVLIGLIIFNLKTQSRYNTQEDLTDYAIQYKTGSQNLTNAVRSYAVTGNIDYYNDYYQELNVDKNRDNALSKLQEIGLTEEEQSYIDQISQTSNNLVPLEEAAMKAVQEGRMEDAREAVYGQEYEASLLIINSLTDTFIESMKERIHKGVLVMGVIALIFDAICFIVLGIVIFTVIKNLKYIKKELINPILIVERQMDYIANGNLSTEFELEVNDSEIGLLAKSIHNTKDILKRVIGEISSTLKEMAKGRFDLTLHENYIGELSEIKQSFEEIFDELNDTFYQIQTAANHVNESSSQMAEAAQDLAEGTTNQASVVEEILASMNTIEDTIEEDAKEAKKSADVIADIGDSLGKSYEMLIHLKNIIDALKSEGIIHKTNSNELVSVPSFIFTEIKKMFKEEGTVSIQDTPRSIPQKALEVFSVGEEREQEKLKKARGKRVIRFKKTLSKVLLNEMRLDLKRKSRINVIFIADENLNNKSSFLLQIPLESISQVISNLESYNESYKREESNDIKEIKPAIVSEGLTDAENNSRRKKMINMMIAALKEEDRIESIKASTSSGVRISR